MRVSAPMQFNMAAVTLRISAIVTGHFG
jgi:hypothetical protein